jgi:hypothetical protein
MEHSQESKKRKSPGNQKKMKKKKKTKSSGASSPAMVPTSSSSLQFSFSASPVFEISDVDGPLPASEMSETIFQQTHCMSKEVTKILVKIETTS